MVYQDINQNSTSSFKADSKKSASLFDRFLSALLDYFIFSPVVAFFMLVFFKDSTFLIKQAESLSEVQALFFQMFCLSLLLFSALQASFIYFSGATPGQRFLKLYVHFENKSASVFFQAWLRQIGFCISIFFLGLPFIAIIYHAQHRTWYDRLAESDVLTWNHDAETTSLAFMITYAEKKYFSSSISVMILFVCAIVVFSLVQNHQETVSQQIEMNGARGVASEFKPITNRCDFSSSTSTSEMIKKSLALNILNLTSDDCVLSAADTFFTSISIDQEQDKDFFETQSLAYFAKYYVNQNKNNSHEYLELACAGLIKSDLCIAVQVPNTLSARSIASEKPFSKAELSRRILSLLEVKK